MLMISEIKQYLYFTISLSYTSHDWIDESKFQELTGIYYKLFEDT